MSLSLSCVGRRKTAERDRGASQRGARGAVCLWRRCSLRPVRTHKSVFGAAFNTWMRSPLQLFYTKPPPGVKLCLVGAGTDHVGLRSCRCAHTGTSADRGARSHTEHATTPVALSDVSGRLQGRRL